RATLAHEVSHRLYNYGRALGRTDEYWAARGGLVAPETEVFAEDGRLLFGSPQAAAPRHRYYLGQGGTPAAGDLGISLLLQSEEGKAAAAKRERLRQIILSWLPPPGPPVPGPEPEAPEPTKPGASSFVDVEPGRWSAAYIRQAAERGIMRGDPEGTFRPSEAPSREELAAVAIRLDDRAEKRYQDILNRLGLS
ncbi:MAG: S-layer homology domain-containing protein, partial [Bacillota bacterium]